MNGFYAFLRLLSILLFLFYFESSYAQRYLALTKARKPHRQIVYYEGEAIRFRLKGERFFISDYILGLYEDEIRFHYYRIKLNEIAEIDIANKNFSIFNFQNWSNVLLVGGPLFLVIDQFNQVVIREEPLRVNPETAIVSSAIGVSGLLLKLTRRKRWRSKKRKHRLKIVDLTGR